MNKKVNLYLYNNSWFKSGNSIKKLLWYTLNVLILENKLIPFSFPRKFVLQIFGAKIGKGVIIKPGVNIKYPWNLEIGDNSWIGENVWIDNLDVVYIGNNVCISQGAMLLCGNHNFKTPTFDLIIKPIILEDGAWVGAKSLICPGITFKTHSILTVGSVANKDLDAYSIYKGNPAIKIKSRKIE